MNSQLLLSQIDRSETYPKMIQISPTNNQGYVSMALTNWTPQMFYELPYIKFYVYTLVNGEYAKYTKNAMYLHTYYPNDIDFTNISCCHYLKDIPDGCFLSVEPVFDNNAISARNMLIENGLEDGQIWTTQTDIFNINLSFLTD
jgi:hypothetical protein